MALRSVPPADWLRMISDGSKSLLSLSDAQGDFSTQMALLAPFVRFARLSQKDNRIKCDTQQPGINQVIELGQVCPAGIHLRLLNSHPVLMFD